VAGTAVFSAADPAEAVERLRDRAVAAVAHHGFDDTQEGDGGGDANHDDERGDDGGDATARSGR
jgi:hypothetical protein